MCKFLIAIAFLCSCVNGSAPPDSGVGSTQQSATSSGDAHCVLCGGDDGGGTGTGDTGGGTGATGMCGDQCFSAADCGGSAQCRICAGMPGTGRGNCLSGNPVTGAPPAGMVLIVPELQLTR